MPFVTWSVLVYCVALFVALNASHGSQLLLAACALVATPACVAARRAVAALLCAIAGVGVLVAIASSAADVRCRESVAASDEWLVDLEEDAAPGHLARGTLAVTECVLPAMLLVSEGSAHAGERVRVTGQGSATERGLFVQDASVGAVSSASPGARARAATGRRIDRVFGTDAAMVRALVIADMAGIPQEVRDRYAQAGLVHMLSVSGLHVGIVALALELLASVLRLPLVPARFATMLLIALYVAAIGAPPPAVRAAVMLGALLVSRMAQRPTSRWAILALGALAPLWDPRTVLDLGWQLSVAGTAALVAGGTLARRIIPEKWGGWRRNLATAATISVVATAVTAPLVAWTFGRVSLVGPVTNLLADPIMGLLQPLLFAAVAIPVGGLERLMADASHVLIAGFDGIARGGAAIPGAAPSVLPTAIGAVAAGVASLALLRACIVRDPWRTLIVGASAVLVLITEPLVPHRAGVPELHMIDVGQGDALAIRSGRGRWIVLDAGRSWIGGDAGKSTVVPYIAHLGGDVALFVLSHPHADHVGGAASLFSALRPRRFLDPGYVGTTPPYLAALAEAQRDGIPWTRVHPGDSIVVDDVVLRELAPDSAWASRLTDPNLASSVLVASIGGARVLFTGDAEAPEERWLLDHDPAALRADVLKVAHHGSTTSSTAPFLDAVAPSVALISVGARNTYGHPDAPTLDALRIRGVTTLRSDLLGTVVLRFTPAGTEVNSRGNQWVVPRRRPAE